MKVFTKWDDYVYSFENFSKKVSLLKASNLALINPGGQRAL